MPEQRTRNFNVLFSDSEYKMLDDLGRHEHTSMGEVVRKAIRTRHTMVIRQQPTCADSAKCMCPHLHAPARSA